MSPAPRPSTSAFDSPTAASQPLRQEADQIVFGEGGSTFLTCGLRLVHRQAARWRSTTLPGPASILSVASSSSTALLRSSDERTLLRWNDDRLEPLGGRARWLCADAESQRAVSIEGEGRTLQARLHDLRAQTHAPIAVARATLDSLAVDGHCAITPSWLVLTAGSRIEVWRPGQQRALSTHSTLRRGAVASAPAVAGNRAGWLESIEKDTLPWRRARGLELPQTTTVGRSQSLEALESREESADLDELAFDLSGHVFSFERHRASRLDDGVWRDFFHTDQPSDCYTSKSALSPDGRTVLLQHVCPPAPDGRSRSRTLHVLGEGAPTHDWQCPLPDELPTW